MTSTSSVNNQNRSSLLKDFDGFISDTLPKSLGVQNYFEYIDTKESLGRSSVLHLVKSNGTVNVTSEITASIVFDSTARALLTAIALPLIAFIGMLYEFFLSLMTGASALGHAVAGTSAEMEKAREQLQKSFEHLLSGIYNASAYLLSSVFPLSALVPITYGLFGKDVAQWNKAINGNGSSPPSLKEQTATKMMNLVWPRNNNKSPVADRLQAFTRWQNPFSLSIEDTNGFTFVNNNNNQ